MKHDKNRPTEPKSQPTHPQQPSQPQQPGQPIPGQQPNRREDRERGERKQDLPMDERPGERSDRDSGAGRPVQLDETPKGPVK